MKRICLWSGPRNVSTALMYSFAQRPDTIVVDEPLYASYLDRAPRRDEHPVWEKVIASQPTDLNKAIEQGMLAESQHEIRFIKNMAQHWRGFNPNLLEKFESILLFRHPALVARSFDKIVTTPTPEDLGYPMQLEICSALQERGLPILALDSSAVRNEPERELSSLCERLAINFDPAMLSWNPGPRPEDGVWAGEWYGNVHRSTGFLAEDSKPPELKELPESLHAVVSECIPMWEELNSLVKSSLE